MNLQPSYILCRCRAGLNDCLNQLWEVTQIAKQLNREILFQMPLYKATRISDILDFSKYPVPVHVDEEAEKRLQSISMNAVFPESYATYLHTLGMTPPNHIKCNATTTVPRSILIIHDSTGGGHNGQYALLKCIFKDSFIKSFYEKCSPPPVYYTIHVRNTDLSTNLDHADGLIGQFVSAHKSSPIYILTDNPQTQDYFVSRYGLRKTPTSFIQGHTTLHSAGTTNTNILFDAFYDLCLVALSSGFLPVPCENRGIAGFGHLCQALQEQKKKMMTLLKRRF
jgi:hypothetical protein